MQLFQVKDDKGNLIMNAPLEVVRWVFGLPIETTVSILHVTNDLGKSYRARPASHSRWQVILIERLPMEVPAHEVSARMARVIEDGKRAFMDQLPPNMRPVVDCIDEGCPHYGTPHGHTTETTLGRLLCDE